MRKLYTIAFLLLGIAILSGNFAHATTTDTLTRSLLIDGIVTTGATPGTNGGAWETDEFFPGYSAAVNWYVSWDDNNLYLGRTGGNNAEGSVLYMQAVYPGDSFAARGFNYEGLAPSFAPMGGVNFAMYLKNTYDECRTFNGTWSGATTSLTPMFSTQSNGANMEVAVPWSAITAGNGRPISVRFVMYQVTPAPSTVCTQEWIYGESPWGTGNPGDGPSAGVNDGATTSLRQLGGCNVGDSTAWRWWGCLPVIGNISGNAWSFVAYNPASDSTVCSSASSAPLIGNNGIGTGTWSQLGGPSAQIANPNLAATSVSNLSAPGQYVFQFVGTSTCWTSYDTIRYNVVEAAYIATVTIDTSLCPLVTFTVTSAGNPSSIDWDLGNGVHLTTATATYDYSSWGNGNYSYQLTIGDACGTDVANGPVGIHCLVGIENEFSGGPEVYPNPNQGSFFIGNGDELSGIEHIRLVDRFGRQLWEKDFGAAEMAVVKVDLPNLAAGQYSLQIQSKAGVYHRVMGVVR